MRPVYEVRRQCASKQTTENIDPNGDPAVEVVERASSTRVLVNAPHGFRLHSSFSTVSTDRGWHASVVTISTNMKRPTEPGYASIEVRKDRRASVGHLPLDRQLSSKVQLTHPPSDPSNGDAREDEDG